MAQKRSKLMAFTAPQARSLSDEFQANSRSLAVGAGTGITSGVGTIYKSSVQQQGGIYTTEILIDLTGLSSSTTDLDIIGVGTGVAHIGRVVTPSTIPSNQNNSGPTILTVEMKCLEAPAGGVTDIDLYSATLGTGVFDGLVTALTGNTALLASGAAWTNGRIAGATVVPPANSFLYLTCGAAGVPGTYTGGKFLITLKGY